MVKLIVTFQQHLLYLNMYFHPNYMSMTYINPCVYPCTYILHLNGNCGCSPILELMQANCINKHPLSHEAAIC